MAQPTGAGSEHPCMMWGGGWFMGPFTMLLGLALIVTVVVLVVRWIGGPGGARGRPSSSAPNILEERFARGEIDEAEFRKRKQALEE